MPALEFEESPVSVSVQQAAPAVAARPAEPSRLMEGIVRWLGRVFGISILAATLGVLVVSPARVLIPFPWQGGIREGFAVQQRTVQRFDVERGARTFFLLHGRYPESSEELEAMRLVSAGDLDLGGGGRWRITASPASFVLRTPEVSGAGEQAWTSSIAGNFLLDPEFVRPTPAAEGPPLVLLD